jgi:hypothetical protein
MGLSPQHLARIQADRKQLERPLRRPVLRRTSMLLLVVPSRRRYSRDDGDSGIRLPSTSAVSRPVMSIPRNRGSRTVRAARRDAGNDCPHDRDDDSGAFARTAPARPRARGARLSLLPDEESRWVRFRARVHALARAARRWQQDESCRYRSCVSVCCLADPAPVLDRPRKLRDGSGGRLGRVKDVIGGCPPAAAGGHVTFVESGGRLARRRA